MRTRFLAFGFALATLPLVATPVLRAQDGFHGALARINRSASIVRPLSPLSGPNLAVADLDGDRMPDGAILLESDALRGQGNFEIELHLSGHSNADIKFQSPEPELTIEALDIDHDGDIDLIIEQSVTRKRLQVWINDGHGNFEKGRTEDFPSPGSGNQQLNSFQRLQHPAVSMPTQRGFETMLMSSQIAGRPPSKNSFANLSKDLFPNDQASSLKPARAPPLS